MFTVDGGDDNRLILGSSHDDKLAAYHHVDDSGDPGDVISTILIDETFATVFPFE
jgi:hypothetical protein